MSSSYSGFALGPLRATMKIRVKAVFSQISVCYGSAGAKKPTMKTSIVLIEDDEISRFYLSEAIALLEVELTVCPDFAAGDDAMRSKLPCLIISDLNLPDGELPDRVAAFPAGIPVLAISAEVTPAIRARLAASGIQHVLCKPMPVAELHEAIGRLCASAPELWNTDKALKALGGSSTALRSMRAMFIAELPVAAQSIQTALEAGDMAAVDGILHRLKASCGFLGAERLLAACRLLDQDRSEASVSAFQATLSDTLSFMLSKDG